jgi:hypothetical protein
MLSSNHSRYASFHAVYRFPKLFCRFIAPVANNEIDESFPISINSNPYPTVVFLTQYKNAFHQLQPFLFPDFSNLGIVKK